MSNQYHVPIRGVKHNLVTLKIQSFLLVVLKRSDSITQNSLASTQRVEVV